jgi:hypothetical protein
MPEVFAYEQCISGIALFLYAGFNEKTARVSEAIPTADTPHYIL